MKKLSGIPVSSGIVIGKAFLHFEDGFPEIPRYSIQKQDIDAELRRFSDAVGETEQEVRELHERAEREMSKEQADIFEAHLLMLEDEEFQGQIRDRLITSLENIEWVIWDISHELSQKLMSSPDPYLRERAVDISDVSRRLLNNLLSIKKFSLADLTEDIILVVHDLMPSDVLTMNKDHVKGIVMDMGSRTSHTAILARAFEIPAVLGLSTATREINDGDTLILNGSSGRVMVNPDEEELKNIEKAISRYRRMSDELMSLKDLPSETRDGRRVTLKANIELPEEAEQILRYGVEGIGLYRSEFLFLTPGLAAEEERQYQAYLRVVRAMAGLPVTIRTVDVGGDKILSNFQYSDEKNPLLGWRAIRFCLAMPEMFKSQLRAILRASAEGPIRVMFPMISGVEELEQALALLEEAKAECRAKDQPFDEQIKAGTMIEVPSAAMTADILAKRSAFFSIGTNDLVQYAIAVDRGNEKVNYLAQPYHPGILRMLKMTIDAAHKEGIKAAMCGEMAGDISFTALLLGLGLDEFSMAASSLPLVKHLIRSCTIESCWTLAQEALVCSSFRDVDRLVKAWMAENFPDA
ncbi:phosphoenolpyruvate--protein phosphotransferase [Treponema sp. OttesenSCG-928-L16]|nr:phosphoenolpyruvate--protein phosphotransferase [Treponema sp. OttesenSCG-928-L16]